MSRDRDTLCGPVRRRARAGAWTWLWATLLACPEVNPGGGASELGACRQVGQRCQYAPGKLGTCVVDDQCQDESCFVCQSQH